MIDHQCPHSRAGRTGLPLRLCSIGNGVCRSGGLAHIVDPVGLQILVIGKSESAAWSSPCPPRLQECRRAEDLAGSLHVVQSTLILSLMLTVVGCGDVKEARQPSAAKQAGETQDRWNAAETSAQASSKRPSEGSAVGGRTADGTPLKEGVSVAGDPLAAPEMKQHAQGAVELGWRCLHKGDVDTALRRFGMAIRHDAQYATGYYGIAYVYSVKRNLKEAVEYYRKTLALDETHVYANANLGFALLQLGREEEATQALDAALKIDPDCGEAHLSYTNYYVSHERWDEAGESARRALELKQVVHPELKQLLESHGVVMEGE